MTQYQGSNGHSATSDGAGTIGSASPNAACPGLYWKPLDAAIGQLLASYCPSGRQGDRQTNDDEKYTYFAGHVGGHGNLPVRAVSSSAQARDAAHQVEEEEHADSNLRK